MNEGKNKGEEMKKVISNLEMINPKMLEVARVLEKYCPECDIGHVMLSDDKESENEISGRIRGFGSFEIVRDQNGTLYANNSFPNGSNESFDKMCDELNILPENRSFEKYDTAKKHMPLELYKKLGY